MAKKTKLKRPKNFPKTLTIKVSKWLRGWAYERKSTLLDENGRMCCLGFLSKACGVPAAAMLDRGSPKLLDEEHVKRVPLLAQASCSLHTPDAYSNSEWTEAAMVLNDCRGTPLATRKADLIEHFKKIGVKLRFVP